MQCPLKDENAIIIAEKQGKHKLFVKHFPPEDNISELFRNTDFALPIEYSTSDSNYFTSFKKDLFLPVHLARLVLVSHFGACGYKCFSNALGDPNFLVYITVFI